LGFLLAVLESTRPRYYAAFIDCSCAGSANETTSDEVFSLLATAIFTRMMIVRTGLNQDATFALDRQWLPVAACMRAAGLLLVIALRRGEALQRT
jgi:hypothetical protein